MPSKLFSCACLLTEYALSQLQFFALLSLIWGGAHSYYVFVLLLLCKKCSAISGGSMKGGEVLILVFACECKLLRHCSLRFLALFVSNFIVVALVTAVGSGR